MPILMVGAIREICAVTTMPARAYYVWLWRQMVIRFRHRALHEPHCPCARGTEPPSATMTVGSQLRERLASLSCPPSFDNPQIRDSIPPVLLSPCREADRTRPQREEISR